MFRFYFYALVFIFIAGQCISDAHAQPDRFVAMAGDTPPGSTDSDTDQNPDTPASRISSEYALDFAKSKQSGTHAFFAAAQQRVTPPREQLYDLLTFEGAYIKDVVQLRWSVQSNSLLQGFKLERRNQSDDRWQTVTFLPSSHRENHQGYTYLDRAGVNGITYYRLRQLQSNGVGIPTPSIVVSPHHVPTSLSIWQHRLDPFSHFGTISFGLEASTPVTITMIDAFSRKVITLIDTRHLDSGHHIVPFDTEKLSAGLYTLRMETDAGIQTKRLALI